MSTYGLEIGNTKFEMTSTLTDEEAKELLTAFGQSDMYPNRSKAILEIESVLLNNLPERSMAQALAVLDDVKRYLLESTLAGA